MNLISIGHYKETNHGMGCDISIHEYLQKECPENIEKICAYLESGIPLIVSPGFSEDVINPEHVIPGGNSEFTDGTWIWPGDLSYYVREYLLKLPDFFLDHIAENNWTVPISDKDIDIESLVIDGIKLY